MKILLTATVALSLAGSSLFADPQPDVCVRDYAAVPQHDGTIDGDMMDPCSMGLPQYQQVALRDEPERKACVHAQNDVGCKQSPDEFDHVRNVKGDVICVINFHQPPISTFCGSNPDLYFWVKPAYAR